MAAAHGPRGWGSLGLVTGSTSAYYPHTGTPSIWADREAAAEADPRYTAGVGIIPPPRTVTTMEASHSAPSDDSSYHSESDGVKEQRGHTWGSQQSPCRAGRRQVMEALENRPLPSVDRVRVEERLPMQHATAATGWGSGKAASVTGPQGVTAARSQLDDRHSTGQPVTGSRHQPGSSQRAQQAGPGKPQPDASTKVLANQEGSHGRGSSSASSRPWSRGRGESTRSNATTEAGGMGPRTPGPAPAPDPVPEAAKARPVTPGRLAGLFSGMRGGSRPQSPSPRRQGQAEAGTVAPAALFGGRKGLERPKSAGRLRVKSSPSLGDYGDLVASGAADDVEGGEEPGPGLHSGTPVMPWRTRSSKDMSKSTTDVQQAEAKARAAEVAARIVSGAAEQGPRVGPSAGPPRSDYSVVPEDLLTMRRTRRKPEELMLEEDMPDLRSVTKGPRRHVHKESAICGGGPGGRAPAGVPRCKTEMFLREGVEETEGGDGPELARGNGPRDVRSNTRTAAQAQRQQSTEGSREVAGIPRSITTDSQSARPATAGGKGRGGQASPGRRFRPIKADYSPAPFGDETQFQGALKKDARAGSRPGSPARRGASPRRAHDRPLTVFPKSGAPTLSHAASAPPRPGTPSQGGSRPVTPKRPGSPWRLLSRTRDYSVTEAMTPQYCPSPALTAHDGDWDRTAPVTPKYGPSPAVTPRAPVLKPVSPVGSQGLLDAQEEEPGLGCAGEGGAGGGETEGQQKVPGSSVHGGGGSSVEGNSKTLGGEAEQGAPEQQQEQNLVDTHGSAEEPVADEPESGTRGQALGGWRGSQVFDDICGEMEETGQKLAGAQEVLPEEISRVSASAENVTGAPEARGEESLTLCSLAPSAEVGVPTRRASAYPMHPLTQARPQSQVRGQNATPAAAGASGDLPENSEELDIVALGSTGLFGRQEIMVPPNPHGGPRAVRLAGGNEDKDVASEAPSGATLNAALPASLKAMQPQSQKMGLRSWRSGWRKSAPSTGTAKRPSTAGGNVTRKAGMGRELQSQVPASHSHRGLTGSAGNGAVQSHQQQQQGSAAGSQNEAGTAQRSCIGASHKASATQRRQPVDLSEGPRAPVAAVGKVKGEVLIEPLSRRGNPARKSSRASNDPTAITQSVSDDSSLSLNESSSAASLSTESETEFSDRNSAPPALAQQPVASDTQGVPCHKPEAAARPHFAKTNVPFSAVDSISTFGPNAVARPRQPLDSGSLSLERGSASADALGSHRHVHGWQQPEPGVLLRKPISGLRNRES